MNVRENEEGEYELVDKEELKRLGETRFPEEIEGQFPKVEIDDEDEDEEEVDEAAAAEAGGEE
jgi:hypothetical protein